MDISARRGAKFTLGLGLAAALTLSVVTAVPASAASVGGACTKIGATGKAGKTSLVCKQAGAKKVWTDTTVYTVEVGANAILGGKNNQTALWITNYVVPNFTKAKALEGKQVVVKFTPKGIDDNAFKTQLALDLAAKKGPDVISVDGFWVAEFAEAGYIKPLTQVLPAATVNKWDGWKQIPASVQGVMKYDDKIYGIPAGTDARIIYFNKALFTQAGLPTNWQPKSWADILTAAKTLKTKLPTVTPFQINANDGMGEATAMQGFLNFLAGAGDLIYDAKTKKWQGNTKAVRDMLGFYDSVYNVDKVGNSDWNLLAGEAGRNESFKAFAEGRLAMMIEGDYLWRSIINPASGNFKMPDRDSNVGFAKIPSKTPGSGVNKQSFVAYSGGSGYAINSNSANKALAWDLLTFMGSKEAVLQNMFIGGAVRITQRADVNQITLLSDPCLKFVFENAIPVTFFRPAEVNYNAVSTLLQKATGAIVSGKTVAQAAADYETALKALVGADKVVSN